MRISELGMLDISIKNVEITDSDKIRKFLYQHFTVTQKSDGVKLSIWRNHESYSKDYTKNWVISYKNRVIYPFEFQNIDRDKIRIESIGISQYALVHDHFKNLGDLSSIPCGTEFFVEFIMNKPTLTRDYGKHHGLVLLAYSESTVQSFPGVIYSNPTEFNQTDLEVYAKILGMSVPNLVFDGWMHSEFEFRRGIKTPELMTKFQATNFDWNDSVRTFESIKKIFLSLESPFGGKEEGVVLKSDKKFFKFLQPDQHDRTKRREKKKRWISDDPNQEKMYWDQVTKLAEGRLRAFAPELDNLRIYSGLVYGIKPEMLPNHQKKTPLQIQDDIYLTGREKLLRRLPENQNVLVIGKMRVLTKAHEEVIRLGMSKGKTIVALVTGKDTKVPFELRQEMVNRVFPKVEVIQVPNANLLPILSKRFFKYLVAGSDRTQGYRKQLEKTEVEVIELPRTVISATSVFEKIDDPDVFRSMTSKAIWPFQKRLKEFK